MVAIVVLLSASCYVLSADLPVHVTARLIAEVRDHFHAGCVYILHSSPVHGNCTVEGFVDVCGDTRRFSLMRSCKLQLKYLIDLLNTKN